MENLIGGFSLAQLLVGFVVSTIGLAYIRLAKVHGSLNYLGSGLAMMVIPYFPMPVWMLVVGSILCGCFPFVVSES